MCLGIVEFHLDALGFWFCLKSQVGEWQACTASWCRFMCLFIDEFMGILCQLAVPSLQNSVCQQGAWGMSVRNPAGMGSQPVRLGPALSASRGARSTWFWLTRSFSWRILQCRLLHLQTWDRDEGDSRLFWLLQTMRARTVDVRCHGAAGCEESRSRGSRSVHSLRERLTTTCRLGFERALFPMVWRRVHPGVMTGWGLVDFSRIQFCLSDGQTTVSREACQ